ncbi:MAG: CvpA family protein [Brevinematales bacterium]|nr:CvpA family protein [Brevinematales bacterium]
MQGFLIYADKIFGDNMQFLDLIILFLLIMGFIWGFFKGFFYMIFSFIGIAVGIIAGLKIPPLIFTLLKIKPVLIYQSFAFIILFTLSYLIFANLGSYISETLENLDLGWIDSLLGGILGVLQISLIIGLTFTILENLKLLSIFPDIEKSTLPLLIKNITNTLIGIVLNLKKN